MTEFRYITVISGVPTHGWIDSMITDTSELERVRDQFWPSRRGHHYDEKCCC
jgi:hypothetical protein